MSKLIDLTGQRFDRLKVIKRSLQERKGTYWFCECDCGKTKVIQTNVLRNGNFKSCGCYNIEQLRKSRSKEHLPHYKILRRKWVALISRCTDPKVHNYHRYGGRGVGVCDEWLKDFESFYNWSLDSGYKEGLTIERKDFNGNYEPSNCEYITNDLQARNKSSNKPITINGVTKLICEWSEETGLNRHTLKQRVDRGWTGEDLLKPAINKYRPKNMNFKKENGK